MRIRQIKPAFWKDSRMAELPYAVRLFYIGLWCIADDAGWLRWDAYEVGCELFGGEPRAAREKRMSAWILELQASGRVILHSCGHVEVPHLAEHQRLAGPTKQVRTEFNDHLRHCIEARTSPLLPAGANGPDTPPDFTGLPTPRVSPRKPATPRASPARNGKDMETERDVERNGNGTVDARKAQENDGLRTRLGSFEDVMATKAPESNRLRVSGFKND